MLMSITDEKHKLRQFILNKLRNQNQKERNEKSSLLENKIISSREFQSSKIIMLYAAMSYEVETIDIIEHALRVGKVVLLPRINTAIKEIIPCKIKDLEKETYMCKYGFREPNQSIDVFHDTSKIDMVVVPGIAFDSHNNRLGRGAGYYDRFLVNLTDTTARLGICFDFQVQEHVPCGPHDQPVDFVISNS